MSTFNQMVLMAHGIDPSEPALPERLAEQSRRVAPALGRVSGIVQGQD